MLSRFRKPRGFVPIDVIMGIAIVLLLLVLTHTIAMQRRATERLADTRAATALAERALIALQGGGVTLSESQRDGVVVTRLDDAADGDVWVEVRATVETGKATLLGVARGDAVERWETR